MWIDRRNPTGKKLYLSNIWRHTLQCTKTQQGKHECP
jgi:hypothetical protein